MKYDGNFTRELNLLLQLVFPKNSDGNQPELQQSLQLCDFLIIGVSILHHGYLRAFTFVDKVLSDLRQDDLYFYHRLFFFMAHRLLKDDRNNGIKSIDLPTFFGSQEGLGRLVNQDYDSVVDVSKSIARFFVACYASSGYSVASALTLFLSVPQQQNNSSIMESVLVPLLTTEMRLLEELEKA
ncbi:hypothetical protein RCL1_006400 [Eukaryota sp. TZLM3-RCL]